MSTIDWSGFRMQGALFPALIGVASVIVALTSSEEATQSVFASGMLCFLHVFAGHIILEKSFGKPPTSFLKRVLGGMGLRLGMMLLALLLLLRTHWFDVTWLLLSLLGWYALALVFEITALQRKAALTHDNG